MHELKLGIEKLESKGGMKELQVEGPHKAIKEAKRLTRRN